MPTCVFFGHRDSPGELYPDILAAAEKLILDGGADRFLAGSQGSFDRMVLRALGELKRKYPHIRYFEVLAYLPKSQPEHETLLPEGIETVPPRFAISRRNRWMVREADFAIVHVDRSWGGAAEAVRLAGRQGCYIIFL